MADSICKSCDTPALDTALFCYNCGYQLKCTNCQEPLITGANNCIACGTATINKQQSVSNAYVNIIKLRENKDERIYEIEFTNEVGKEIKEVVADLLKNKIGSGAHLPFLTREAEELNLSAEELMRPLTQFGTDKLTETSHEQASATADATEEDYPHLNDLEIKLNCKENEWLLLFAFYLSAYGTTPFSKEAVWQLYKDKRKTESRFKNLGTNWKSLFKKYICTVKENEFRFTPSGLLKVKNLLHTNQASDKNTHPAARKAASLSGNTSKTSRSLPLSRKVVGATIAPDEFDVYKNDKKESLETFFIRKDPGTGNPNRIITIAYYITRINHQEYFTEGNIDFAYRILNLAGKPVHLKQIITNLKNDRIWFQKVIDRGLTGWKLTRQGEIYVEEKLPPLLNWQ